MAAKVTARKLLLQVRNDFNSFVHADSLIPVFQKHKLLKKRERKFLVDADDISKKTLLFHKMYNSEGTSSPLSTTDVIQIFVESENEKNILFAEKLQSILSTLEKEMAPRLPPFKYSYSLNNNSSAIFSSIGGVLYLPVYGVTVYIPAGAILGEEQVEVSFRLVTVEAEIKKFLSHSMFEGSVVCSGVFAFEAKLVDAPAGLEFTVFHSDVWVELPHCLSFKGGSLKDYTTAFVVSERRGKVEVEEQALFSVGYPYVNLPVRHFSKFCAIHTPKKRFAAASNVKMAMQKLCISRSLSGKHCASPHVHSKQLKQEVQGSANISSDTVKRALFLEMEKASSKASAEEQCHSKGAIGCNQPSPEYPASIVSLQQEPLNVTSMSIIARVYQPRKRNKLPWWTADLVFAPHLHNTYKILADFKEQDQFECCSTAFHLELQTQLIQLKSGPPTQGWSMELSTTKILLEHLVMVAPLLGVESECSSKMADSLPRSTASVQNCGAFLPLRHPIEVERSYPPTRCYLTCDPVLGEEENCKVQLRPVACAKTLDLSQSYRQHGCPDSTPASSLPSSIPGPSPSHSTVMGPTPTAGCFSAPRPPQHTATVLWERDYYVLALLSIMIPEQQLLTLGESLGLQPLTIDQVMSGYTVGSTLNVGERAYEMFRRASLSEQVLTFGKILVSLSEIDWSNELVPILRSYLHSFDMATPGTPAEGNDSMLKRFLVWLRVHQPTLIPLSGVEEKKIILPKAEQDSLFLYLSPKLVCVWRMVGRMLGLTDSDIAAIDAAHNSQRDRESEPCHQMLLKWVGRTQNPSDITYYRLMAALQLTSRGTGAVNDAIFYLRSVR